MKRPGICEECEELWRDFGYATVKFARLSFEQQANNAVCAELEDEIDTAAWERELLRRQIAEHNAAEHDNVTGRVVF